MIPALTGPERGGHNISFALLWGWNTLTMLLSHRDVLMFSPALTGLERGGHRLKPLALRWSSNRAFA